MISEIGNLLPPDNEALREAAWLGHLGYDSQPAPRLMEYLRPCYLKEIDSLGIKSRNQQERFEDRLGEFLVNLHLGGFLPADVLDAFWKKAPERLLRYSMWALGRYMKQTPEQMPDEVRARGHAYWSARLSAAKAAANPDSFRREIGAFDQWCRGTTDTAWLLDQLCEMLTSGFAPTHSFGLVEWLAELSLISPDKAVEAMLALVSGPHTDSSYLYHHEPVQAILTKGFTQGTPATKKRVEEIVSILSTKGETKYADVLRAA